MTEIEFNETMGDEKMREKTTHMYEGWRMLDGRVRYMRYIPRWYVAERGMRGDTGKNSVRRIEFPPRKSHRPPPAKTIGFEGVFQLKPPRPASII